MTDWDMVVETFPSSPEFPTAATTFRSSSTSERSRRAQPVAVHDHRAIRAGLARTVHVPGSRHAVEHGRRGTCACRSGATSSRTTTAARRRSATGRYRSNPTSRSAPTCSRTSRSTASKLHFDRIDLETDGASSVLDGDIDLAHWPEQIYRIRSRRSISRRRRASSSTATTSPRRARGLHRHLPPVQGRARAERDVRDADGAREARRERPGRFPTCAATSCGCRTSSR